MTLSVMVIKNAQMKDYQRKNKNHNRQKYE